MHQVKSSSTVAPSPLIALHSPLIVQPALLVEQAPPLIARPFLLIAPPYPLAARTSPLFEQSSPLLKPNRQCLFLFLIMSAPHYPSRAHSQSFSRSAITHTHTHTHARTHTYSHIMICLACLHACVILGYLLVILCASFRRRIGRIELVPLQGEPYYNTSHCTTTPHITIHNISVALNSHTNHQSSYMTETPSPERRAGAAWDSSLHTPRGGAGSHPLPSCTPG